MFVQPGERQKLRDSFASLQYQLIVIQPWPKYSISTQRQHICNWLEYLKNNPATWLPSIFYQHCAVGCNFSYQKSNAMSVCSSEETLHQDFACSHPAEATGSTEFSLCPLPLCPAAFPPSHHHLFPGAALCPPCRADPECWRPHTTHTREDVCVFGHPHMWHHNQITNVSMERTSKYSFQQM